MSQSRFVFCSRIKTKAFYKCQTENETLPIGFMGNETLSAALLENETLSIGLIIIVQSSNPLFLCLL